MAPTVPYAYVVFSRKNDSDLDCECQVGQAVIQIAAHRGLKTLNLVRDRSVYRAKHIMIPFMKQYFNLTKG